MRVSRIAAMTAMPCGLVRVRLDDHAEAWLPVPEVRCNDIRVGDVVRYAADPRTSLLPLLHKRPPDAVPFTW